MTEEEWQKMLADADNLIREKTREPPKKETYTKPLTDGKWDFLKFSDHVYANAKHFSNFEELKANMLAAAHAHGLHAIHINKVQQGKYFVVGDGDRSFAYDWGKP